MTRVRPEIRPSTESDMPAVSAIYAEAVLHGTATFELEPPDAAEMIRRRATLVSEGYPHLVAVLGGKVAGYAYAGPYRPRPAYRFAVEDSIYLADWARGQGVGKALLKALITRCEALGKRQMIAVIGDAENTGSIGVHEACGFAHAGLMRAVGYKFGRWIDVVVMQRPLGPGGSELP